MNAQLMFDCQYTKSIKVSNLTKKLCISFTWKIKNLVRCGLFSTGYTKISDDKHSFLCISFATSQKWDIISSGIKTNIVISSTNVMKSSFIVIQCKQLFKSEFNDWSKLAVTISQKLDSAIKLKDREKRQRCQRWDAHQQRDTLTPLEFVHPSPLFSFTSDPPLDPFVRTTHRDATMPDRPFESV